MEKVIIWGAGKAAIKRYLWVAFAGCRVIGFVDNDTQKWGKAVQGITIYSPEILRGNKWTVVVPDLYREEIKAQLDEISYQGQMLAFEQFRKNALVKKEIRLDISNTEVGNEKKETTFVFDSFFLGMNWGGVESWSCVVANQLLDLGIETKLICGENKKFDECTRNCIHFWNIDEIETVKEMAVEIIASLPCVFITHGSISLYAAQIVKSIFPKQIKLVAVAHGDESNTYKKLQFWSDQLDKIICISKKIWYEFQNQYGVKKEILLYKQNPITIPPQASKRINRKGVLRIGFAARLRKEQKRVHLLPIIIELCLGKIPDVEFNIAGEGECLELLRVYVTENHLEDKVHILGWIPTTEMVDFWNKQDIYLNISDFEGMSLAMLEAMACGTVPVVTDVSGVRDVIEDGKNGFIVPVDSWLKAADKIEMLGRDREMLQLAGNYNMNLIREKCDVLDYAKWLIEMFYFC